MDTINQNARARIKRTSVSSVERVTIELKTVVEQVIASHAKWMDIEQTKLNVRIIESF